MATLEAALVRARGRDVVIGREQQGHVHRDTREDQLLDRGEALRSTRHLDVQVGDVGARVQGLGFGDRAGRVVREARRHLERHPPVDAVGLVVAGPEQRRGPAEVVDGEVEEHVLCRAPGRSAHRVVVVGAARDRLVEDGRVRREPGHRVLGDVAGEGAGVEQRPGDVVEPDALAGVVQTRQRVHVRSSRVGRPQSVTGGRRSRPSIGLMGGDPEGIDPQAPMPQDPIDWSRVGEILQARVVDQGSRPFIVGIAGPVAVGKSTLASRLRSQLEGSSRDGPTGDRVVVEVLGTDGFLFPNAVLEARGLALRKGFPESYDAPLLERTLDALRIGGDVSVPVYSHETYDIVPGATRAIRSPTVLILEGVNALWFHERLDYGIYIDAPVTAIEAWYVARLVELVADAPSGTFYAGWTGLTASDVVALAHDIWRTINAVNLAECIEPTRALADLVVEKGPDHELVRVGARPAVPEV